MLQSGPGSNYSKLFNAVVDRPRCGWLADWLDRRGDDHAVLDRVAALEVLGSAVGLRGRELDRHHVAGHAGDCHRVMCGLRVALFERRVAAETVRGGVELPGPRVVVVVDRLEEGHDHGSRTRKTPGVRALAGISAGRGVRRSSARATRMSGERVGRMRDRLRRSLI